jgi:diaminopimelate decarboxylase
VLHGPPQISPIMALPAGDHEILINRLLTASTREAIEIGRNNSIQQGFNEGFTQSAYLMNENSLSGILAAISIYINENSSSDTIPQRLRNKILGLNQQINHNIISSNKGSSSENNQYINISVEAVAPQEQKSQQRDQMHESKSDSSNMNNLSLREVIEESLKLLGLSSSSIATILAKENSSNYCLHDFYYNLSGTLFCEGVDVNRIARDYSTPTYIYSAATLRNNYHRFSSSFTPYLTHSKGLQICYAMKANSTLAILKLFSQLGSAFDLVSGGELMRVLSAGGDVSRSVFAGVGKSTQEIELALHNNIYSFHVESAAELARINEVAARMNKRAPIALRINPNVDAATHAKITTGKNENKFGIPFDSALQLYELISADYKNLEIRGVQMHIGSQLTQVNPFIEAVNKLIPLVKQLKQLYNIEYFSIGGGVGVIYESALASGSAAWWQQNQDKLTIQQYAASLGPLLNELDIKILIEPGRSLVASAGILLSRVEYIKQTPSKTFVIVDAAMNDLIRPALYEAYHEIVAVQSSQQSLTADIVGPVCESGDSFASNRVVQGVVEPNSLLAFLTAGAYGYSMSSNYNSRVKPCQVLVNGSEYYEISKRETFQQQITNEIIPHFLSSSLQHQPQND